MSKAQQEKASVDWLTPRTTGLPKVKKKEKQTKYDLVSAAIYWAERNGARLAPSPSPLRQEQEDKTWVDTKCFCS